jgi:polyhydroxybutyrate depolymerase
MKKNVLITVIIVALVGVLWSLFKPTQTADRSMPQTPDQFIAQTNNLGIGEHDRILTVGGLKRTYLVHVPNSYDGTEPYPVVLGFHGGGSDAKQFVFYSGLNETADRENFIAVYPNGTGETIQGYGVFIWNGGSRQPGGTDPNLAKVDDVEFTKALLNDLATVVRIDEKRIYATGLSAGGIMTYRLALELSDRIAAIAPIASVMGTEKSNPQRPVSVIHFHGTKDEAVPFKGGKGKLDQSGTDFYSVEYSIQSWVKANGCKTQPIVEALPDKVDDGTKVIRKTYGGGKEDSEVVLIEIEGGGHTWPGRETLSGFEVLGKSTKDISANDLMWEFFQKHPMQ